MKRSRPIYLLVAASLAAISWFVFQENRKIPADPVDLSHTRDAASRQVSSHNAAAIARNEIQPEVPADTGHFKEEPKDNLADPVVLEAQTSRHGTAQQSSNGESARRHAGAKALVRSPSQGNSNRGVQLAENVKLPAAVMALAEPSFKNLTPQQNTALQNVIDTFYRDLAAYAESQLSEQNPKGVELVQSANGGETFVIQPGPDVEKARNHANEIFRALFGDDRYNQVTSRSAMEAMLPSLPKD